MKVIKVVTHELSQPKLQSIEHCKNYNSNLDFAFWRENVLIILDCLDP